jgi:5-methylcytosine-specific restriction endonuclease McrA
LKRYLKIKRSIRIKKSGKKKLAIKKLSERKKALLREFSDHTCEECGKTEFKLSVKYGKPIKLQPHRIKQGGEYSLRNIKIVCPDCHKIFSSAQNKTRGIIA